MIGQRTITCSVDVVMDDNITAVQPSVWCNVQTLAGTPFNQRGAWGEEFCPPVIYCNEHKSASEPMLPVGWMAYN